jgi:outer membrane protein assembly factor BamB
MAALLFAAVNSAFTAPPAWWQFRLHDDGNAALPGTLSVSWHLTTDGPFSSSPTIVYGTLFIGNNAGQLFAIDPVTGAVRWTHNSSNPLMSEPIVYGNLVIAGVGNENSPSNATPSVPIHVGDPPNALYAVNRVNGAVVWRVTLPGTGMPTPAIVGGLLVHHNGAGTLIALDPSTGQKLYESNLHSIASMSAALPIGNDAFVTNGVGTNAVFAVNAKDGSVIWRTLFSPVASGLGDCPAVAGGGRIFCDYAMPPTSAVPSQTERNAHFRAFGLDLHTGKKLWDILLENGPLPKRNEAAIPLLAQRTLFLGSSVAPQMHAIDPASGRIKWRARTRGAVKGGIVDVNGTLYFGDLAGYLWALRTSDGHVIGVKNMHSEFNVGSPIVVGQTLIIGSRGGTLYAVPLAAIRGAHDR